MAAGLGVSIRQRRRGQRRQRTRETDVDVLNAQEKVQNSFVETKTAVNERRRIDDVEEPPVTQRRGGRERAPVRVGQHRKRQPECRPGATRIVVRPSVEGAQFRIEFSAGTHQEHVALEIGEGKRRAEVNERRRRSGGFGFARVVSTRAGRVG